jgi:ribosomal-protein-alanine N-acetyltransferase
MDREAILGAVPTLSTPRLILRKLRISDAEDIFDYARDPEVTRYVMWEPHETRQHSEQFITRTVARPPRSAIATWGIELKTGGIIGTIDLRLNPPGTGAAEIGYTISRKQWNRGYTTEAVRRLLSFAFESLDVNRVEALCFPENIASARVMEKAGMSYEGTLRDYRFIKGGYRDLKMYSVLRREWTP